MPKTVHPITDWEKKEIEKINSKLKKKGLTPNDLVRKLGSYNYDQMRDFLNNGKGSMNSRTLGRVHQILK
jgi:hypothetical protein